MKTVAGRTLAMPVQQPAAPAEALDAIELRRTLGAFATGVTVITARHDGSDHGMTANAFMSVSLKPPLIVVSVNRRARLLAKIEASGRYAVSILAEDMEAVALHFAGKPKLDPESLFEDYAGLPVIPGAVAHFAARLVETIPAGDHALFIGAVEKFSHGHARPLLFHGGGFRALPDTHASTGGFASWPAGAARISSRYVEEAPQLW
jgi:flavin reductase (DIM6/NTAB) family NADH-FMN oxidoreductase RutF